MTRALRIDRIDRGYRATVRDQDGELVGQGEAWTTGLAAELAMRGSVNVGVACSDGSCWWPRHLDTVGAAEVMMTMRQGDDLAGEAWKSGWAPSGRV